MIAIVDYDAGNLKSVEKALLHLGAAPVVTKDAKTIRRADKVILPGVGAFGDATEKLKKYDLTNVLKEVAASGTPFLGICLGLQLLFPASEETIEAKGLSILEGEICRIPKAEGLKIPHMGWNSLKIKPEARLFRGIDREVYVYFVHSYYLKAKHREEVAATTEYGVSIDASIEKGNIFACQFHPEKSGETGLRILDNFLHL
jgi:glutamine amidotransferase